MPQLSPLNWILLFLLFWTAVLVVSVMIWWTKKNSFTCTNLKKASILENKWNW
uniref:ATP synthase F0 subunit 8 n=1 Tax=Alviniconcha sp. Al-Pm-28 TaxID=1234580 RepID=S6BBC3_9CAEN|nr:ATP synthase F0 subunit 8 [Alviniconcha kojimai]WJK73027.1 ATP synthase F0 subunit 8 [Alviniconcha kojimai]BAN63344.1 ATP synthase F0 subunit 8 [Alviniconcha sp. Al-Pm-28]